MEGRHYNPLKYSSPFHRNKLFIHTYIYRRARARTHTHSHTHMCVYSHTHMCVCVYIFIYLFIYVGVGGMHATLCTFNINDVFEELGRRWV
jgi:hypothetical protein